MDWSPDDILEVAKRIKPDILDRPEFTKMLIGKYPNTYAFTKAVTEQALREKASDLPLSIFRPSIVVAAAQEPVPGWIDNLNGPTGKCPDKEWLLVSLVSMSIRNLTQVQFLSNSGQFLNLT